MSHTPNIYIHETGIDHTRELFKKIPITGKLNSNAANKNTVKSLVLREFIL